MARSKRAYLRRPPNVQNKVMWFKPLEPWWLDYGGKGDVKKVGGKYEDYKRSLIV